jgi:predicted aspartyl protease
LPAISVDIEAGGAIVTALVGVSFPRMQALQAAGEPVPPASMGRFLIDTGASSTCADPGLIGNLNLPMINQVAIMTPSTNGSQHMCDMYDASIFIPGRDPQRGFLIPALQIITTHLSSQGIDGLIGRDILNRCTVVYIGSEAALSLNY